MYSPIIPINNIVIPLKNVIPDISEAQPTIVEWLKYAKIVHSINMKLNVEINTPERVIKCNGTAEKLETPFKANNIIFFKGYLVVPASLFLRS